MLIVKSVPRAVRPKSFFAALSVLLMIAGTLFGANVGQASSTTAVTKQSLKTCVNTVSGSVYLRTGRLCNSKTGTTVKWFRSVKPAAGKTVVTLVSCVNKKTRSTRLARSTRCKSRTEKKVVWSRLVTAPVESEVVGQDPSATEPAAASLPVITSLRQASATTIEVSFSMTSVRTTTRDGGVTTYTVTASTSSGDRSATGTTSPITVTGLTQYTAYTFIVTATGADGSSRSSETSPPVTTPYAPVPTPPTSASPVVTPVTVPGAPTIGVATATGATTATVAFTAPVSDGGSTITTYTATSTPAGGSGTLSSAGSGTITVTGLTTGTSYTFTVTATNSVGTSAASAASAAVIPTLTCAAGGACSLGDIGPGGGLVFLISGGLTYEMAPKTWNGGASDPSALEWCSNTTTSIAGAAGTAIGTGAQNTVEMDAGCTSGAGQEAADYVAGGKSDWFLPSKDLVNEMYGYQSSIVDTATYGFTAIWYWSSSQSTADKAWAQSFQLGLQVAAFKTSVNARVRPVRAF